MNGQWEEPTCWVCVGQFSLIWVSELDGGSPSGPSEAFRNISAHPNSTSKNSRNVIYTTISDREKVIKKRRAAEQGQPAGADTRAPPHPDSKSGLRGPASLRWWLPSIWLWSDYHPAGSDPGRENQTTWIGHIFKIRYLSPLLKVTN